ncbi:MAG TPA: hypothetical protein VKA08_12895 [Balneolales bacterium]|nr:hypothetical protein [Balneolales bacterium]
MEALSLELFTQVGIDFEVRQYHILDALKDIKRYFSQNKLYPYLSELVDLYNDLRTVSDRIGQMEQNMPHEIKSIDLRNKKITYQLLHSDYQHLQSVKDIINWALPFIDQTIREGVTIYEFVDENFEVEQVGITPTYTEEGYVFIPDNNNSQLLLFRYELSIFIGSKDRYRSLKTHLVKSVDVREAHVPPSTLKLELIRENHDLPNPATYAFNTRLDFPFHETLFPVARRKFMQLLQKEEGK